MKDLTKKTKEELAESLSKAQEELRSTRFSLAGGKEKNVKKIREMRKTIARLLTQMGHSA
jgi:ribosomal protein L29